MDINARKLLIHEDLVHGDAIKLDDLYNKFLPCCVKTGNTSLTRDVYFIHDISELGIKYKAMLLMSNHLPILTTSTTRELMSEYNQSHNRIFERVYNTIELYNGFKQKNYKQAMIDKQLIFMPLNGTVRKNTSFINPMYITNFHKIGQRQMTVNFTNFLGIDLDYGCQAFNQRVNKAVNQYMLYFFPETFDVLEQVISWKGDYLMSELTKARKKRHSIDSEKLTICRKKVDYFLVIQQFNQSLTIQEFIEEFDSYWDKI
ncbi:competence protein ComK [Vagococcus teuberi]|uniref:Uncharacterized protein n=1 Tax=Vagococcus teuberi TaxID=519472 RepID=A0A1J0A741_9ENTE|nr:competence protein ComK [Vagococcus teuberi]APB31729.1 hypothetical protein BHY08_07745 [Vagococcus teuberi]